MEFFFFSCFHVVVFIGKTYAAKCYCEKNTHSTVYTLFSAPNIKPHSILRRVTNSAHHPIQPSFTNRPSSKRHTPCLSVPGRCLTNVPFTHRLANLTTPNSSTRKPPMTAVIE